MINQSHLNTRYIIFVLDYQIVLDMFLSFTLVNQTKLNFWLQSTTKVHLPAIIIKNNQRVKSIVKKPVSLNY